MSQQTCGDLTTRIERLERENRRLKGTGLVTLALMAAVILMGQAKSSAPSEEVRTRKLLVLDTAGKTRASLAVDRWPKLTLYDEAERERVRLVVDVGGSSLKLSDESGKIRASLKATDDEAMLDLSNDAQHANTALVAQRDGACLAADGNSGLVALGFAEGGPSLWLADARGYPATFSGALPPHLRTGATTEESGMSFIVFDKDKKVLWRSP